jgi:transposase InsO family protein
MDQICAQFGITRQAHYQKKQREAEQARQNEIVLEMVRQVRRRHPRMGGRKVLYKIQSMLDAESLKIGRDRLFDLLRDANMLVKPLKKYHRTTIPGLWRAPNRLPGLLISQQDQVWVCDITYLELMNSRFAYLFLLMDLYSRYIIGWHVSSSLASDGAVASLEMAMSRSSHWTTETIHHSDHGVQYTNHKYMTMLHENGLLASMGAVGNCYDNIYAERVIGSLKGEYALNAPFVYFDQISPIVEEAIYLYNSDRPHNSLGNATPKDVYDGYILDIPMVTIPGATQ